MTFDRRKFLIGSLAAAGAAACGSSKEPSKPAAPAPAPKQADPATKKSILVLGGTGFLGPHVVEYAKSRGHTITLFNRGKTRPNLFPDVEKLQGDRDGKLEALKGRTWDAVVDTSGYVPRIVKMSAELLAPSVQQYIFVSTISVYDDSKGNPNDDETAPLQTLADATNEDVRASRRSRDAEARREHPPRPDRRPRRSDRPILALGHTDGRGRRSPRAR